METSLLIGSSFEEGAERPENILNPRTGKTILEIPEASQDQIDRAVAAAGKAFASWSRTPPQQRSAYLLRIADAIEAGMLSINHHGIALPETPFGGVKDSGFGHEGGIEGLQAYMQAKFVSQLG